MVHLVWVRYGSLVGNIHIWKSFFTDFAENLEQLGAPFENLIGFVDGKWLQLSRLVFVQWNCSGLGALCRFRGGLEQAQKIQSVR
jgi:hypothetical protein